ncbi:hypothetical protein OVA24_20920 [Luteolibacter sp. SL250]|uniref:hypothetical protein n=1 Tax=Luteolibacter sp. SL250 TaxID=2995170 RepID=UPI00226F0EB9|nr:hypothetical protein [Luteolibacter sp. SL250]WAC19685.1 hypothetical protein OVA24_20920 [Luteolibacter sp. SL250]
MKKKWLLMPLAAAAFASCEKQEQAIPPAAPTAERKTPAPNKIEPVAETAPTTPPAQAENSAPGADTASDPGDTPAPSRPAVDGIPVAKVVEGKPGFVFSPFNDKVVDVRNLPPGTLVADPTFPASEKKHFRLPP